MATGAMLWGGAAYNNGIVPYKNYIFGEAYTARRRAGEDRCRRAARRAPSRPRRRRAARCRSCIRCRPGRSIPPGDIFRVFERGGRNIDTQFAEIGLPNPTGSIQRLEEPGRPDLRQSNRGPGTGLRVAIPVLNIHKTRLNDPFMWFMGTNDQPGDYRQSGCAGCHVIYANDREPQAQPDLGAVRPRRADRDGRSDDRRPGAHAAARPSGGERRRKRGHPIEHAFTRAIPTAQCMNCHMHQPNIFLNSYLGYTMWDYESDAPLMWPEQAAIPDRRRSPRDPSSAIPKARRRAASGAIVDFLRSVYDDSTRGSRTRSSPTITATAGTSARSSSATARAICSTRDGKIVAPDDPEKFRKNGKGKFAPVGEQKGKAVHMMDIHAEKGMQCADCHFAQDSHGNGLIYGEVANAVEIGCKDCHGTADAYPDAAAPPARPRGPRAPTSTLLRNPDGQRRFEWTTDADGERVLIQRSIVDPEARMAASAWSRNRSIAAAPHFNAKAARAKLMATSGAETGQVRLGPRRRAGRSRAQATTRWPASPATCPGRRLRRLPPADRGELEDQAATLRGRGDAQLRDLQPAGRARRHVPARHAT